jgi:DNA polymerase I-like protein with 3'-5' exonuclease and polymerase domains
MQLLISDRLSEVKRFLAQSKAPVVVDIETTSLFVGKGRILCVGFGHMDRDDVMVWWPRDLEELRGLRLRNLIAHNSPFERRWLCAYGVKLNVWWDSMFMAHLINENQPSGLKDTVVRLLGYEDWADDNVAGYADEFGRFEDDMSIDRKVFAASKKRVSIYNGKDVHRTRELVKWQRKHVAKNLKPGEDPVRIMREVMIPAIEPLQQMEANRMPVRLKRVAVVQAEVEQKIADIEQQLDRSVPDKERWPDWLQKTKVNWGNTNWTKWWLFEYQGALCPARGKPTKTWPEGNPSLAAENLAKIDHPAARLLTERGTLYKQLTGFLNPIQERTKDGRIGTSFKLTGTVTGRLSSASPGKAKTKADLLDPYNDLGLNSQQIPRDKATRNLFGERGLAWIEVDFSQLELRIAARLANEKTMLTLFEADEDIHMYMAKRLVREAVEITKEHRSLAKGANFGFLYGMMAKHFADYLFENYGVQITRKEAEVFRDEYFTTFSALPGWYRKQRAEALEFGGVHNEFGRFRHLPKVYHQDFWIAENAFRQAINSPVQSLGSDFMLISLGRLGRDLRLPTLGAKLITTVHDSVCLTAPYKTARRVGRIVKETMENADDQLSRKFFLKADVTISRCWGGEPLAEF